MKLLHFLPLLILISALVLESEAWFRRRRRRYRRLPGGLTICPAPPTLPHTYRSGCFSPYTHGQRCTYRCHPGYTQVSGSNSRTCSFTRWLGSNLVCRNNPTCSPPPTVAHTYVSGCSSPYTNGERCTYRCRPGYSQVSSSTVKTCSNGAWTGTDLVCRRGSTCPTPPTLAYTSRSGCYSPYTSGERCYYRCYSGYSQVSGSTTRICSNGRWTGYNLVCRGGGSTCPTPPTPAYTYRSGCSYPYTNGERCYYRCRPGYSQGSGSTTRICSNGRWTGYSLVCRRRYWAIDRR